jgi:hypothetical protein
MQRAAAIAEREAAWEISTAHAGFLPSVDIVKSWQRSHLPVLAFRSLLSQRRFTSTTGMQAA